MADLPHDPQRRVDMGNISDNVGNAAIGSGNTQSAAASNSSQTTNIYVSSGPDQPAPPSQAATVLSLSWHDNRPDETRSSIIEPTPAEEERLYNLSHLLRVSRCLVFNRDTMLLPISHLFNRAKTDGLEHHYQAVCWFMLEPKSELFALAPALPKFGISPAVLTGKKKPLARSITFAKILRQRPTLLVLQGFDEPTKSLPADFSALLEMALEDDIGSSSIVILSASKSLTLHWGAKLDETAGYQR
jgi:hypothetical protein